MTRDVMIELLAGTPGGYEPLNSLWENDVLLVRSEFEFPPFEEGYRYRLLHGGISHVGSGGGYRPLWIFTVECSVTSLPSNSLKLER